MNNTTVIIEVNGKQVLYSLVEALQTMLGISDFLSVNDVYEDKSGPEIILRWRPKPSPNFKVVVEEDK